ncbi:hypothetical protein [Rhodohalobacter sulfatireducens]|uniref:Uncharacterized protein n=1 Tax=Rhodohalobacter sulfatireducens TaxID=2911366 RepID=A0ABS9KJN8_9BACT|nr:hypothetical protein [Rhodohalobacter sulfatireducens]MCG2591063.1 hypothetical protein [Rhodohalobacter sulfatireducens]
MCPPPGVTKPITPLGCDCTSAIILTSECSKGALLQSPSLQPGDSSLHLPAGRFALNDRRVMINRRLKTLLAEFKLLTTPSQPLPAEAA